eukprot:12894992-Prorocentrum_lima.AAC.1
MGRALEVWIRRHGKALQPRALQPLLDFSQGLQGVASSPLRSPWVRPCPPRTPPSALTRRGHASGYDAPATVLPG